MSRLTSMQTKIGLKSSNAKFEWISRELGERIDIQYITLKLFRVAYCHHGVGNRNRKTVKSYAGNDLEKSTCVLRRFRKTVSVGADVTSDGRLFQRRHPAMHRKLTVADSGQPCTSDRQLHG